MLVCRQWAEVIIVIPIALIMINIHILVTILNHQVGHRRWAEFSLHLEAHKLITCSGISRLSKSEKKLKHENAGWPWSRGCESLVIVMT